MVDETLSRGSEFPPPPTLILHRGTLRKRNRLTADQIIETPDVFTPYVHPIFTLSGANEGWEDGENKKLTKR